MTYQYIRLAVGRLKRYWDADYVEPCDEHGSPLPYMGFDDDFYRYGTMKVIDYEIKDRVMYCRLKGATA